MGEVARLCGDEVAHAMMKSMGGARFYVPKKYTATGPLAVLSREHAEALIAEFGAEIIYVPSAQDNADIKEQRFQEVERLVQAGVSTAEIANRLSISQTYVFALRREFGAQPISEIRKRQKAALSVAEQHAASRQSQNRSTERI
ncbi:hypothetical protein [Ruegeria arenilitoris]|uniref:hypothetical protein n=1 Tax=Ruegeria arenilitoris TaxID=1173585 RepID=UPI00147BFF21|nr:hypothetical protein [Ruegeria arenilitoris]